MRPRPQPKPKRFIEPTISNQDVRIIRVTVRRSLIKRGIQPIDFNSSKFPVHAFGDEDRAAEEREAEALVFHALKRPK